MSICVEWKMVILIDIEPFTLLHSKCNKATMATVVGWTNFSIPISHVKIWPVSTHSIHVVKYLEVEGEHTFPC